MKRLRILSLTPMAVVVGVWFVTGVFSFTRRTSERHVVAQVKDLLLEEAPSRQANLPVIRGKVLLWDLKTNHAHPAQKLLHPDRRAASGEDVLTIVAVVRVAHEAAGTYKNGETGYRQVATVRVAYWPENKRVGSYAVVGEDPPLIVFRRESDTGPILGDLDKSLARWVNDLPVDPLGGPR
jgi:hypothetical protein